MTLSLILDITVILLLISTIIYAAHLNKKLSTIYQSRGELQKFLTHFTASLSKAEQSMQTLRTTGESAFTKVQEHMKLASSLKDDLHFLVERGETIASQLDNTIREGRQFHKDLETSVTRFDHSTRTVAANTAEPELIQAIRNVR